MRKLRWFIPCLVLLAGCDGSHSQIPKVNAKAPLTIQSGQAAGGSVHPPGWGATPRGVKLPAPLLGGTTSTATMFDSVTLAAIPSSSFAVAGYTAGNWPTYLQTLRDFPRAHHISIAIHASYHAMCLDDEPGDAAPSEAGPWALADIRAGFRTPCVYSDLSEMPAVQASLRSSLGPLWHSRVLLWLAWYRNVPGLVSGYDAVQYYDRCLGRNLDCSTVSLAFLRIASPPYAPTPPKPRLVCFGPHAQLNNATCKRVRPEVSSWSHARDATARAIRGIDHGLGANRCRTPYRRDVCVDLGQEIRPKLVRRERLFDGLIHSALSRY